MSVDLFLRAADETAMLAGLAAAGFTTIGAAGAVVAVQASHNHALDMPVTVTLQAAVTASDGTVVQPAVIDERYFARLRILKGYTAVAVGQALAGAGVEILDPDGAPLSFAGDAPSLSQVKVRRTAELAAKFRALSDAGMIVGGRPIATSAEAVVELSELVAWLDRRPAGSTLRVATRAGDVIDADLATASALYEAVTDRRAALQAAEAERLLAIMAAETIEAAEAVDLSGAWI